MLILMSVLRRVLFGMLLAQLTPRVTLARPQANFNKFHANVAYKAHLAWHVLICSCSFAPHCSCALLNQASSTYVDDCWQ